MVEQQPVTLDLVFRALGDATRRAMLKKLASREHTVSELAEPFTMSLAAASKHIRTLEQAGLVRRRVQGRTHFCQINPKPLAKADEWLRAYERLWDQRLADLELLLRHPEHEEPKSTARTEPTPRLQKGKAE